MSDAVRRLVEEAKEMCRVMAGLADLPVKHYRITDAIAAVEAELNAPPAVTDAPGFDGRAKEDRQYIDYVENYR